jgi:hypothetical protein
MNATQKQWEHAEKVECISKALQLAQRTKSAVAQALGRRFTADFPHITAMLSDPAADIEQLTKFIDLSNSVASGSIDQHQASVAVGQALANQYVTRK